MLRVNSVSPVFKGVWGDIQYVGEKPVAYYYPFIDETKQEIENEIKTRRHQKISGFHNPLLKEIEAIVTEPLKITKADFEKCNRGFLSDSIAKLLLKK